jgi:hypothetical protein
MLLLLLLLQLLLLLFLSYSRSCCTCCCCFCCCCFVWLKVPLAGRVGTGDPYQQQELPCYSTGCLLLFTR